MAKYNSLGELFTAIADAIRAKTGGTDEIVAEEFPTAIEEIESSSSFEITELNHLFAYGARFNQKDTLLSLYKGGCKNFSGMFLSCSYGAPGSMLTYMNNFVEAPELDTSEGTNFDEMFYACSSIKSVPIYNVSKGTSFRRTFATTGFTVAPELDMSSAKYLTSMFSNCSTLRTVPVLNTSNAIQMDNMFSSCGYLETVLGLDLNSATDTNAVHGMFMSCKKLTNLTIYNIRSHLAIGSGTTWGHLLTVDSLVHTIQELCTVTSTKTLTMGSANLEKIAGLYCKIIDDTNEKKTMELCESTDEGAMTLADYAAEKGWTFA